ncbi:MAG: hypothetical protein HGB10_01310 [Coriobacteriia bacterium]|nr:hypothetical protein [Coriobacteriia bacterium]
MDRILVHLEAGQLDDIISIGVDGSVDVDTEALARVLSKPLGLVGVRVAVANADYLQHEDGSPEPDTRTVSGIWWHPKGDDTALTGGFIVEGHVLSITTEGEGESPLAEGTEVIERATKAIASQHEGSEVLERGLFQVPSLTGEKPVRVVVTRDYRIRRPQDLLDADELVTFDAGRLALAIVQMIGGGKALVIKHGI